MLGLRCHRTLGVGFRLSGGVQVIYRKVSLLGQVFLDMCLYVSVCVLTCVSMCVPVWLCVFVHVHVSEYMCDYVVHVCTCVSMYEDQRSTLSFILQVLFTLFFEMRSLIGACQLARWVGQWIPMTHLPPPAQCWDFKCVPPCSPPLCLVMGGGQMSSLTLARPHHLPDPLQCQVN